MTVHRKRTGASRQQGAAALMLAALMVVFTGTLIATYYLGSRSASSTARFEQIDSLRWAQESITGFATANGRLPCPASLPDGLESCALGFAKGWLPTSAIEQFGSTPAAQGRMPVRYVVYRGTGGAAGNANEPDLALADDAFQPTLVDGSAPAKYPPVVSGADLCGKLRAAALPKSGSRWQTGVARSGAAANVALANVPVTGGGSITNVAYGIAASPIGTAKNEAGLNGDAASHLESPYRAIDNTYRDVVRVVDFATLSETLSCPLTMASLDTLATAAGWTADSIGARQGAIDGSDMFVKIEGVIVSAASVGIVSATIDMRNAAEKASQAATLVAVKTPLLPESAPSVAMGTAGIATAASALALAEIDLVRAVAGATVEATYMGAYGVAKKVAEDSRVWVGSASILAAADRQGISP